MTFDTKIDSAQVFRYSIVDGIFRIEIAQLDIESDFSKAKHGAEVVSERQNGWEWIREYELEGKKRPRNMLFVKRK